MGFAPGIFLRVPIGRFEYVSRKGRIPRELRRKIEDAGFEVRVCRE